MGIKDRVRVVKKIWKKYCYPCLILLVGIGLMLLPGKTGNSDNIAVTPVDVQQSMEERLEEILTGIEGVGRVDVLLSVAKGESVIYQMDEDKRFSENDQTNRVTTVTITQNDRSESGLIRQIDPPRYQGAIVSCQGALNANVRLAVVDAVSKVTGLGADCIAVVKMK